MPTPTKGARLGGSPSHERLILANLASQLFEHRRIVTTETKAKRLRPLAEKLITKAKRGDLHARRQVMTTIRDNSVVHVLFTEIAPAFDGRDGGYTRITKVGPRKGDNAPMAVIELVTETVAESRENKAKGAAPVKKAAAKKAPAKKATAPEAKAADTTAEDTPAKDTLTEDTTPVEGTAEKTTPMEATAEDTTPMEATAEETAPVETTAGETSADEAKSDQTKDESKVD